MALDKTTFAISAMSSLEGEQAKTMLTALVARAANDSQGKAEISVKLPTDQELGTEIGEETCWGVEVCLPFVGCSCVGIEA